MPHKEKDFTKERSTWTLKLSDIKAFSTFLPERPQTTAKFFLNQSEQEAEIVGVPQSELLRVVPFVLRVSALRWYTSNEGKISSYNEFRSTFVKYSQSDWIVYTKLIRLQTVHFYPKMNCSIEIFWLNVVCRWENWVSALLPLLYQRHLTTPRIRVLVDLLEVVRKPEFIENNNQSRRFSPGVTQQLQGRPRLDMNKTMNVNEVYLEYPYPSNLQQKQD